MWDFVWCTFDNQRFRLEPLEDRKVTFKLNQPTTAELTIPLDSTAGRFIAFSTAGSACWKGTSR